MKNKYSVTAAGLLMSSLLFSTESYGVTNIAGTYLGEFNTNVTCGGVSQQLLTPSSLVSIDQSGSFFNGLAFGSMTGLTFSGQVISSRNVNGTYQYNDSAGTASNGSYTGRVVSSDTGTYSATGTYSGALGTPCSVNSQGTLTRITPAPFLEASSSTSLSSTSPSSASSRLVYDKLNPKVFSHRERLSQAKLTDGSIKFALADLKYEQARYTHNGEDGHIGGMLMSVSTEISGVEIGAYIPYDYLSFESFTGHRTGTMLYAKRDWKLPLSLQLTTMANFNYMATYVTQMAWTNTFGGGFATSLSYDDAGDFIPRVSFAFQYNQDDYYKANDLIKDNHQYLVKTGASLGYRLFENATVQAGFVYNRDVTSYQSTYNKMKDNDYFELMVGGSYAIADMWQVNLSYKRILGLRSYYSNALFIGTNIGF